MTVKKGDLGFDLHVPSRLEKASLSIEVRSSDRKLVGRFDAKQTIEIDPGDYFVSVRLPGGDELTDWVEVPPGGSARASLAAGSDESLGAEIRDVQASFSPTISVRDTISEGTFELLKTRRTIDPAAPVSVRAWAGAIGAFHPIDAKALTIVAGPAMTRITLPAGPPDQQCLFQLLVPRRPGTVVVVPARPDGPPCTMVVRRAGDELNLDAHLENEVADVIIRDTTEIDRTKLAATALSARGLLQAKSHDPIAAAAGAVALLGIDQAERVHSWLRNLAEWFPWLPDGPAIAAESSARIGHHAEAVELLMMLGTRGIPVFAASLGWALDRLARYERSSGEPVGDRASLRKIRERLQLFGELQLSGYALTTFRAIDPNAPDDELCGASLPAGTRRIDNLLKLSV